MALIAKYRTKGRPDRGIIEDYDADAYEADREAAVGPALRWSPATATTCTSAPRSPTCLGKPPAADDSQ